MKFKLSLFLLSLVAITLSSWAQTPFETHGQLSVSGGTIVNQHGVPPQLRGISFSWSLWQGQKYYTPEVVDWLCQDFKVSLIRVSMGVEPEGGYLDQPEFQKQLITPVVDQALKNGIYVLLDWHDHHAEKNIAEAKAFFSEMARKYGQNPQVIFEIFNEPERQSWETVKNYSIQLIAEIRKYAPKNLIVIGSPHWDQHVNRAADDPIVEFENLCYSFHFYASDDYHQDALRQKADYALAKGLPLFVTEWGVGEANGDGRFDVERTNIWIKWMEDNRLSWACWNLTDKAETTAFLKSGASAKGNWSEEDLTPNGIFIRLLLRELNK